VIDRLELDLPVLYDAYNVESQLKASVYPDTAEGREALERVRVLERRALELASRITTCSADDASALAQLGARSPGAFVVVPNGTEIPDAVADAATRAARSARWRHRYWAAGSMEAEPRHLAVFFGSWHPPNVDAAELLIEIAPSLDGLLILAVGRHGDALAHRATPPNLVFTGAVSERAKDRLLGAADLALNPMRIGSGTNLKLLEYLACAIPVVSTPFGARGIDVIDGTHLRFAEPAELAATVTEVLADPAGGARRAEAARSLVAERYAWTQLGSALAGVIDDLAEPGGPPARQ
jgi:glycosyltransferase involved in cell wall biosynthesis